MIEVVSMSQVSWWLISLAWRHKSILILIVSNGWMSMGKCERQNRYTHHYPLENTMRKYFVLWHLCRPATYYLGDHDNSIGILFMIAMRTNIALIRMAEILLRLHYHLIKYLKNKIKWGSPLLQVQNKMRVNVQKKLREKKLNWGLKDKWVNKRKKRVKPKKSKMNCAAKERENECTIKEKRPVMLIIHKEAYFSLTNLDNPLPSVAISLLHEYGYVFSQINAT